MMTILSGKRAVNSIWRCHRGAEIMAGMEVEFDINADDHFALYAHRFREATPRKRRGRCPWWAWLILVLFLGFLILGSLTSGGPTINLPQSPLQVILIGIVLSLILLTVLGPRMLALLKYHLVKKRLREAENRGESLRIYFRITAEGLALTNEIGRASCRER